MVGKAKSSGKNRGSATRDATHGARKPAAAARILRIIGGRHRGRRLQFPAGVDIRPTPDRVRETLFNWLQPRIVGAQVLDLFSGSGALGLEALSRGAAGATFVEQDRRAAVAIEKLLLDWQETQGKVVCAEALGWLGGRAGKAVKFDVVFLDPPYDAGLLAKVAELLADGQRLNADARIYLERRARDAAPVLPAAFRPLREGRAGEVGYHLYSL